MHWTIEANMISVLDAIDLAHDRAAIVTFPELAVTGFHRDIASLATPELIAPQIQRLREVCDLRSIAVAIGAPTFGDDNTRFNSHILIDEAGALVCVVSKIGLTSPESTFFNQGVCRPVAVLQGVRCTAVICREVEDHAQVCGQVPAGGVDVIFWPGQMRPDPEKPFADPPMHVVQAQQLARALGAHIVQANWPNALNRPDESEHAGHSAVIGRSGELLFRLPKEASGVAIFTIGENRFEWHAREDWRCGMDEARRMTIRRLCLADATAYRQLMLEGYERHPEAFTSSVSERAVLPMAWWESRVSEAPLAREVVFGAFAEGRMAGVAGLSFETREKTRHKASLFGMYVPTAFRHRGLGRGLVLAALDHARCRGALIVQLTVIDGNARARALYEQCGFVPFGLEPLAVAIDSGYVSRVHMWCNVKSRA